MASEMIDKGRSREIRREIRRVLMAEWDPIGVNDIPQAADEYDSYMAGVYELLERGASEAEISAHLREIEVERMEKVDGTGQPLMPDTARKAGASTLKSLSRHFGEITG